MTDSDNRNYIKMTETPVPKLVMKLAVPTTISMLITSIYNTADTYFVSRISVSASGATGIVCSLMVLLQAFGFMFGHGAGSNISRLLGAKDTGKAGVFASTSFFSALTFGFIVALLGNAFNEPFMRLLGSTDTILADATAYAQYIFIGAPALIASCVLNNILRYEGRANFAMIGLATGGILNMFLDPLFIFAFKMGTAGAGLATALSQYISLVILLVPFLRGQTSSKINPRLITKRPADFGNIIVSGMPNLLRQGLNSISMTLLNTFAAAYGDAAIAAFSIVTRVSNMVFSIAIGLAQGFQPVCAFNYGAKKYGRVRQAVLFTLSGAVAVVAVLGGICALNAEGIVGLFRSEEQILDIGSKTLRFACAGIVTLPFTACGSMVFQSTGQKGRAIFIAAMQSGLIYIPMLLILPKLLGLTGLELAQPVSYAIGAVIAIPMIAAFLSKLKAMDAAQKEESLK